jgi:hypothetical protein
LVYVFADLALNRSFEARCNHHGKVQNPIIEVGQRLADTGVNKLVEIGVPLDFFQATPAAGAAEMPVIFGCI